MVSPISLKLLIYIPWFLATPKPKDDAESRITHFEFEKYFSYDSNYTFSYKTSDGISRNETGTSVNFEQPDTIIRVEGTLNYKESNGNTRTIRYSSDNNIYNWTNDGKQIYSTKLISPTSLKILVYVPSVLASQHDHNGTILRLQYWTDGRGGHYLSYKTTNHVYRQETGTLVNAGLPDEFVQVVGNVRYPNDTSDSDGWFKEVVYIVDRNGYRLMYGGGVILDGSLRVPILASLLGNG